MPFPVVKKIIIGLLIIVFLILIYIFINTSFIAKDYIYGPPLLVIKNRYLSVDIYPRGCQSATVLTNNNIEGKTEIDDIAIFRHFLKKRGLRAVFFIIPNYKRTYPLDQSPSVVAELKELKSDGHEIAQCGTYHTYGPDLARGSSEGGELVKLDYDEQVERIEEGKKLLTELGFPPAGFRAPEFLTNRDTFRALETRDYLFSSNSPAPPRTWNTLLQPPLSKGVLYPYHPSGFELLEFTDHAYPTQRYAKSVRIFNRVHALQGVFVCHTYISYVAKPERLQLLNKFLDVVQKENTWCCTLSEISQWWLAREKMRLETRKEGQTFIVTLINKTPFPLNDLGLRFLKFPYGVREFVIQDQGEKVLARGELPLGGKIFLSVPGNPKS